MNNQLVCIIWKDAAHYYERNYPPGDDYALRILHNYGVIVQETDEKIAIAVEYDETGNEYGHVMVIPKCLIVEIKTYEGSDLRMDGPNSSWTGLCS